MYISRKLKCIQNSDPNEKDVEKEIFEKDLLELTTSPFVILGEPGLGKTELMKQLGTIENCEYITAKQFLRGRSRTYDKKARLVIDGLDEVPSSEDGNALQEVLKKLNECDNPNFAIACREKEWNSKTGKQDIKDDYGIEPIEFRLLAITKSEAMQILSEKCNPREASEALDKLDELNLSSLYCNPNTLQLVSILLNNNSKLPETKSKIYAEAMKLLVREDNDRHKDRKTPLAILSDEDKLDVAGAICFVYLLHGYEGITSLNTNQEYLQVGQISDLADLNAMDAILGSNLFEEIHNEHGIYQPKHKTIAEYLAARWISEKIDNNKDYKVFERRLSPLFNSGGTVPTYLKGFNNWLPIFSPNILGPKSIQLDPFGFLTDGDCHEINDDMALHVIKEIKALSKENPYFRSGGWENLDSSGICRPIIIQELNDIIDNQQEEFHIQSFALEIASSDKLCEDFAKKFKEIAFNNAQSYHNRNIAIIGLYKANPSEFLKNKTIEDVLKLSDQDSTRLALSTINEIGFENFDIETCIHAILAEAHLTIETIKTANQSRRVIGSLYPTKYQFPISKTIELLDTLSEKLLIILPDYEKVHENVRDGIHDVSDLITHLISRLIESDSYKIDEDKLLNWLSVCKFQYRKAEKEREIISKFIDNNPTTKKNIQYKILTDKSDGLSINLKCYKLYNLIPCLKPNVEELKAYMIEKLQSSGLEDKDAIIQLINRIRPFNGKIEETFANEVIKLCGRDNEIIDLVTAEHKYKPSDVEIRYRKIQFHRRQKKKRQWKKHRKSFLDNVSNMEAGDFNSIYNPACAYLGKYNDLNNNLKPFERISNWIGSDLAESAAVGFENFITKDGLPNAKQVSENFANSTRLGFLLPAFAGVIERLRNGKGIDDIDLDLISSLEIAIEYQVVDHRKDFAGLRETLLSKLNENPETYEAHIRTKFEPHFVKNNDHIFGLYSFARDDKDRELAIKLCSEWITIFPNLNFESAKELASRLLNCSQSERTDCWNSLTQFVNRRLSIVNLSEEEVIHWNSMLFAMSQNSIPTSIPLIDETSKQWIWEITRNLSYSYTGNKRFLAPNAFQLEWIISNFRTVWPNAWHPTGTTSGDKNPWDAAGKIRWAINALANIPGDDSSNALKRLSEANADTYSNEIKHAAFTQHKLTVETLFNPPSLEEIKSAVLNQRPTSAKQVKAIILEEIASLQSRLKGDQLDIVNLFYTPSGQPKGENDCRSQMLIAMGINLPFGIQNPIEMAMPQGKRADVGFSLGDITIPLEAKGQWHDEIWIGAQKQLENLYLIDHRTDSQGIYLVFWFEKDVMPNHRIKLPPNGKRPETPEEMLKMLQETIPPHRKDDISIVVLDVSRN